MTKQEAIRFFKCLDFEACCRCIFYGVCDDKPICNNAKEIAIECIAKLSQIEGGIGDLKETLDEAYKLNDYVLDKVIKGKPITECEDIAESYSLKAMQNLGWLMGVLEDD